MYPVSRVSGTLNPQPDSRPAVAALAPPPGLCTLPWRGVQGAHPGRGQAFPKRPPGQPAWAVKAHLLQIWTERPSTEQRPRQLQQLQECFFVRGHAVTQDITKANIVLTDFSTARPCRSTDRLCWSVLASGGKFPFHGEAAVSPEPAEHEQANMGSVNTEVLLLQDRHPVPLSLYRLETSL